MADKLEGLLFVFVLTLIISTIGLGMCYLYLRSIHSPLRLFQKKVFTYAAILLAACPVLGPLCMASVFWLMPIEPTGLVAIVLFLIWAVITFVIVRRLSEAGGLLGEERE